EQEEKIQPKTLASQITPLRSSFAQRKCAACAAVQQNNSGNLLQRKSASVGETEKNLAIEKFRKSHPLLARGITNKVTELTEAGSSKGSVKANTIVEVYKLDWEEQYQVIAEVTHVGLQIGNLLKADVDIQQDIPPENTQENQSEFDQTTNQYQDYQISKLSSYIPSLFKTGYVSSDSEDGAGVLYDIKSETEEFYTITPGKTLAKNTLIEVLQSFGDWLQVSVIVDATQSQGFLRNDDIVYVLDSQEVVEPVGPVLNQLGRIAPSTNNADRIAIYNAPNQNAPIVANFAMNSLVRIVAEHSSPGWIQIESNFKKGWVRQTEVAYPIPEPQAILHRIGSGECLESVIKKYANTQGYAGKDHRVTAAAIYALNQPSDCFIRNDKERTFAQWLKDQLDPEMAENREIYREVMLKKDKYMWIPSGSYVELLIQQGVINQRSGLVQAIIDIGRAITDFSAGLIAGFFGEIWDTLTGFVEIGKTLIDTVGKIVTGEIFQNLATLYEEVKNMTAERALEIAQQVLQSLLDQVSDFVEQFKNSWYFRGKVFGMLLLEVVMAIFQEVQPTQRNGWANWVNSRRLLLNSLKFSIKS
ncbi:MAG: hypothetical protein HC880_21040, partial [Bacteroidia bacterium]|nr:hypothetical protein [Bacteroidia bacterium]